MSECVSYVPTLPEGPWLPRLGGDPDALRLSKAFGKPAQLLKDFQRPEWLISPVLARGCLTLLTGRPKEAGKTTFLTHVVKALLDGGAFLGRTAPRSPVVYATEETATFSLALERANIDGDAELHALPHIKCQGQPWSLLCEAIRVRCCMVGARVAIVDTVAAFAGFAEGQEQDAGQVTAAMNSLRRIAAEGIAVVAVHHAGKRGGAPTRGIRGSTAWVAGADNVVTLSALPRGRYPPNIRRVSVTGRLTNEDLLIQLEPTGYVQIGSGPVQRTAPERATKRSAERLKLPTRPAQAKTVGELADANGCSASKVNRLLRSLNAASVGTGVKNDPKRYYAAGNLGLPDETAIAPPR